MLTKVYAHFVANVNLLTALKGGLSSASVSVVKRRKLSYREVRPLSQDHAAS